MTACNELHEQYDQYANGKVQVGELPKWMRVSGKVAWYIYQGPYSELGSKGFDEFWKKFGEAHLQMDGPPGDVYICSPDCHVEDKQTKMLTIIWCPIK